MLAFCACGRVVPEGAKLRADDPLVVSYPLRFVNVDADEAARRAALVTLKASRPRPPSREESKAAERTALRERQRRRDVEAALKRGDFAAVGLDIDVDSLELVDGK